MLQSIEKIYIGVIITTLLIAILAVLIIRSIIKHQNGVRRNLILVNELKHNYEQEILKSQLEIKEQTLHTISQEIHDNIGQILSLAKLNLNTIELSNNAAASIKIKDSKDLIGQAIQDLRELSKALNSTFIQNETLSESIQLQLNLIQKSTNIIANFEIVGHEVKLDSKKTLLIFRIFQEAFNNIMKHASAKNITIRLNFSDTCLILFLEDDGIGFIISNGEKMKQGTGIGNMKYRADLMEAKLIIESGIDKGTRITLNLPLNS
jgi:two-component system NarL family sensor kinase